MMRAYPIVLVLSAPSGGGKTTVCNGLLTRYTSLCRAITCTTRPPRAGEQDGIDYHFLDEQTFEHRIGSDDFLEHARVYDKRYGTLKASVLTELEQGRDVLLNIDVQGVATLRARAEREAWLRSALVTVFLTPPSPKELESRLRGRNLDSEPVIQRRLQEARQEIAVADTFDFLVISDTREADLQRVGAVYEAERLRMKRMPEKWKDSWHQGGIG